MPDRFVFDSLDRKLLCAPMAGGPSTPELAAAVSNAGGLGFIAGGLVPAHELADQLTTARKLTSGPVGANIYVPQPVPANTGEIAAYAHALTTEAARYSVELGLPSYTDFGWSARLDVVADLKPDLVSFTFGLPSVDDVRRMRDAGITTMASVASAEEARLARDRGLDAVVVQGPKAGGHRYTLDPLASPPSQSLENLLAELTHSFDIPIVAAGGLAERPDVDRVLELGAVAAQVGTPFLLADEAGTPAVHRKALIDTASAETVVTRAFTGRYARAIRNRFIDEHDSEAVSGFPNVALLTAPVLAASAEAGDPQSASLWAGAEFRKSVAAPAADIVASLA